jgi:hypothetical protein
VSSSLCFGLWIPAISICSLGYVLCAKMASYMIFQSLMKSMNKTLYQCVIWIFVKCRHCATAILGPRACCKRQVPTRTSPTPLPLILLFCKVLVQSPRLAPTFLCAGMVATDNAIGFILREKGICRRTA